MALATILRLILLMQMEIINGLNKTKLMKTIYITFILAFNFAFMQGQTIQVLPLESFYENDILIRDNVYYKDITKFLEFVIF